MAASLKYGIFASHCSAPGLERISDMEMSVWKEEGIDQSDSNDGLLDSNSEGPLLSDNPHITSGIRKDPLSMDHIMMLVGYDCYGEQPLTYNPELQVPVLSSSPPPAKKIKPVKRPGLKLKTPIAYRKDSDINMIPIMKDGMAVCEKCGAIGVKHAFYTKERRFCSLACARGYDENLAESLVKERDLPLLETKVNDTEEMAEKPLDTQGDSDAPIAAATASEADDSVKLRLPKVPNTYEWNAQLCEPGFIAAPVSCFQHAPMSDCWDNITVGMKVEVENKDTDNFSEIFPDSFWVATVLKISGYKALLRYEGFGQESSKDFWVSLCSEDVHPVGWCATRGKPLIPPKTIQSKYNDWKEFLMKRLTGARTLPSNFHNKVVDSLRSRFRCGMHLEVVDKNRISQVKVATIERIVGKRLHVTYTDSPSEDLGFWCHEDSPLIHPVGWAHKVGHAIVATADYHEKCAQRLFEPDDATEELFSELPVPPSQVQFKEGMKLEAIDPLNLSAICVATVMKVLRENHIMIRIDGYELDASGSDWFCYHCSSPYLFPAGFSDLNGIHLTPPKGYDDNFKWLDYVQETNSVAAPITFFNRDVPNHGFKVGMRVESADLMDPRLICVGTISRVVGRLLKIHFDGWEEEYDQWLDCQSPDVYPVGWCELVGHKLEGPRQPVPQQRKPKKKPKRRHKKMRGMGSLAVKKKMAAVRSYHMLRVAEAEDNAVTNDNKTEVSSSDETMHCNNLDDSFEGEDGNNQANHLTSLTVRQERTDSSHLTSTNVPTKRIPRLVDTTGSHDFMDVVPDEWNVFDVVHFLRVNDCAAYCDSFNRSRVDGKELMALTKDQIIALTGMKVGPSLKIFDLIQQLKARVISAQARIRANLMRVS